MNPNVAFEIVELALSLAKTQASGKLQQNVALAGVLLQIIEKAVHAYQDHTCARLDPTLIKAEDVL
jgi:hypothetical protein